MKRKELLVYHKNKFQDFYDKYSKEYKIISMSYLISLNFQIDISKLLDEKCIIDISSLIKSGISREDLLIHYEIWVSTLLENDDVKIIIEDSYSKAALNTFRTYFSDMRYLTEEDKVMSEEKPSITIEKKKVYFYDKAYFSSYIGDKKHNNIEVISISRLLKKNNSLDYSLDLNILSKEQKYEIDLSSMIKHLQLRSDLILSFEIFLQELTQLDNVEFISEKDLENDCKQVFRHVFKEFISSQQKEDKENGNTHKSIIDCDKVQLEVLFSNLENELFGHEKFKEDFRKQLKAFKILNKMKRDKVFSMFLCGGSGIGKTEVARILHRSLYPDCKEIKINFGNYSGKGSLWSLIGSPKGYLGSEKGGELTNKIKNSNSKVILIDEFEKADESIFSFFYELLEDGKYTDLDENEIDLNGYIIVFTANLTSDNYKEKIPEPLFSRFDMRYEFMPLNIKEKQDFVIFTIDQLLKEYNPIFGNKINVQMKDELLKTDITGLGNLRDIKRAITNKFIQIVEDVTDIG